MAEGRTMAMTWKPTHPGNWLFHCHLEFHFAGNLSHTVPEVMGAGKTEVAHHDSGMAKHESMAGLVVGVNIKPSATPTVLSEPEVKRRQLKMVVTQAEGAPGSHRPIQVEIQDGDHVSSTAAGSEVGPPLVLHRGEPTEITVVNHLAAPTAIHWHGMEIESYFDGVVDFGGNAQQSTPAIASGDSFVVRVTPARAGTFIYHTHWHDIEQLASGLYGAMIVLEPGEEFDPEHDRVFVVSRQGSDIFSAPLLMNGTIQPQIAALHAGRRYRFRFINITPNDDGDNVTLTASGKPLTWTAFAKDGADLPSFFRKSGEAKLQFGAGETYDFEFTPEHAGDLQLETSFITHHTKALIAVNER
jgi:FtsP/CotA-like multicopper oxidase with cupredoxin domain